MTKALIHVVLLSLIFLHRLEAQTQAGGYSNSSLSGSYFYLLTGAVAVNGNVAPYAELGKLVADGQGNVSGQSKASTAGSWLRIRSLGLSASSLQTAYTEALERCRLGRDGRPPKAEHIQVLVQAWRQLRKQRQ